MSVNQPNPVESGNLDDQAKLAGYQPEPGEIRFDMYEAKFTREGDHCTFEVLIERLGLLDPGLGPIAEIVHDIDVKDSKFAREETLGIDRIMAGSYGEQRR